MSSQKNLSCLYTNFDLPQVVVLQSQLDDTRYLVNSFPLCQHSDKFLQDISSGKSEILIEGITRSDTVDSCIKFMHGDKSGILKIGEEERFEDLYEILDFAHLWEVTALFDASLDIILMDCNVHKTFRPVTPCDKSVSNTDSRMASVSTMVKPLSTSVATMTSQLSCKNKSTMARPTTKGVSTMISPKGNNLVQATSTGASSEASSSHESDVKPKGKVNGGKVSCTVVCPDQALMFIQQRSWNKAQLSRIFQAKNLSLLSRFDLIGHILPALQFDKELHSIVLPYFTLKESAYIPLVMLDHIKLPAWLHTDMLKRCDLSANDGGYFHLSYSMSVKRTLSDLESSNIIEMPVEEKQCRISSCKSGSDCRFKNIIIHRISDKDTKFTCRYGSLHDDHIIHCFAIGMEKNHGTNKYISILQSPKSILLDFIRELKTIIVFIIFSSDLNVASKELEGIPIPRQMI